MCSRAIYRGTLKRRIRERLTVDSSRARPLNFRRGNAASVICRDVFGHLFILDPGYFLRAAVESSRRAVVPVARYISAVLGFPRRGAASASSTRCGAARRDENSRMRSAAGCSLHNAVVTYRACISLPGRGLTAKTAGHRPIFSRDSPINGNAVISRLRSNDCTGCFESAG